MPRHSLISFDKLHKAKFDSGDETSAPLAPEGKGDVYWAPDTNKLYLADNPGTGWNTYDLDSGGGGGSVAKLDNVGDVNASAPTADQILFYDSGTTEWKAKTLPNFLTDFKLSKLVDVTITSAAKGNLIVNNGTNWVNLIVGSNKQVLQADSTQTTGTKWTILDLADTDATYINVTNQSVNPSLTPASGKAWIFVKTNDLYIKKSDGTVIGPFLTSTAVGTLDNLTDVTITSAAKGNLLAKSSGDWVNIGVGSNGQVLTADSTQTAGMHWTTVASPVADFELMVWLDLV